MESISQHSPHYSIQVKSITNTLVPFLLTLSFFILPLGGDLRNIVFPLTGLVIFLIPSYQKEIWRLIPTPYILPMFLFYVWIVIACLWGPASTHEHLAVMQKYSKLLFFAIFALGFRNPKARIWSLYAFVAAALVPCILSILNGWGLYRYKGYMDPGHVFVNHVATGFLLAFVSYLCVFLSFKQVGWRRLALISLGLLFSYQVLFINPGRTGYVVYLVLMIILCLQVFSWKKAFLSATVIAMLFSISFIFSPVMQSGLHYAIYDLQHYKTDNKDTSLGFRMQFHEYAQSLFISHPILGNGSGAYEHDYNRDNPTPRFGERANPHGQYWLVLVEQGLIGLFLWILSLLSLAYLAFKAKEYGPILFALVIAISLTSFSDSILMLSPIGHILVILSALCLGEVLSYSQKQAS